MISREILFRGKRTDNKEWVFGYLFCCWGQTYIIRETIKNEPVMKEVVPETVCQYTGLTDKNGRKIFEGDIVRFKHGGEFHDKGIWYRNYVIEYINTFCTYGLRFRNKSIHFPCKQATVSMHDVEVIGNIFDNPELLEGE